MAALMASKACSSGVGAWVAAKIGLDKGGTAQRPGPTERHEPIAHFVKLDTGCSTAKSEVVEICRHERSAVEVWYFWGAKSQASCAFYRAGIPLKRSVLDRFRYCQGRSRQQGTFPFRCRADAAPSDVPDFRRDRFPLRSCR